jgi:hypothetical protein
LEKIYIDIILLAYFSAASTPIMLPVALAIADECAQYSINLNEEDGELNKLTKKDFA